MSYFIIFPITVIFAMELSILFKRKFGRTVATSNFLLIFILYISGLFKDMRIGMYIWFGIVCIIGIALAVNFLRKKNSSVLMEILKNPLFVFYVTIGFALGIVFIDKISLDYDELSHWALVSKNMFTYDNFGNLGDSTTMFNRYVPATGIFMYAFQFFNPEFVNGNLYSAFDMLIVSMLIPICEKFSNKLSLSFFVTLIFMLGIPVIFKTNIYANLLVDGILAVMTAYIYIAYLQDRRNTDWYTVCEIGPACFVITLTKSSGLALGAIAVCFIIADVITRGRKEFKSFIKKIPNIVCVTVSILLVIFAKVSWNVYTDVNDVRAGWDSSEMTFSAIIELINNPNDFQQQVINKFVNQFFINKPYYNWGVYLALPATLIFGIYGISAFAIGIKTKKITFPMVQFFVTSLALIGYGVFMMLLYVFSFTYAESLRLASYPRYMGSIVSATILIWFAITVDSFLLKEKNPNMKKNKSYLWAIPATILSLIITVGTCIGRAFFDGGSKVITNQYKEWIAAVEELDDTDRVYYLMKDFGYYGNNVREYIRVRFFASPTRCSGFTEGGSMTDGRNAPAAYTGNPFMANKTTLEDLIKELQNYDYIFIDSIDEEFINKFGSLFGDEIKAKVLYRIDKTDSIKLYLYN